MRVLNVKIFDDVISGTSTTWLSAAEFNTSIGKTEIFTIQAVTTGVQGANPSLTITSEHSSDSQNWLATGATEIGNATITENGSCIGSTLISIFSQVPPLAAHVRFRIALDGTNNPRCRLKLYFTGRLGRVLY